MNNQIPVKFKLIIWLILFLALIHKDIEPNWRHSFSWAIKRQSKFYTYKIQTSWQKKKNTTNRRLHIEGAQNNVYKTTLKMSSLLKKIIFMSFKHLIFKFFEWFLIILYFTFDSFKISYWSMPMTLSTFLCKIFY